MNHEFHYHVTQLAALAVGWSKEDAYCMAYSSQHIDDNTTTHVIDEGLPSEYRNYISQTKNILLPRKDLRRIYPVFHFIPGRIEDSVKRKDGDTRWMATTPDSPLANAVMDQALASENPFRIGIAMHGYVDTWAHQGFTGTFDDFNKFPTFPEFLFPRVGHAGAWHKPDVMDGSWIDPRLRDGYVFNWDRCMAALRRMIDKLAPEDMSDATRDHLLDKLVAGISRAIGTPLDEFTDKERSERLCRLGYDSSLGGEDLRPYDKDLWFRIAISTEKKWLSFRKTHRWRNPDTRAQSHWHRFQEAIKDHQKETIATFREHSGINLKDLIKENY